MNGLNSPPVARSPAAVFMFASQILGLGGNKSLGGSVLNRNEHRSLHQSTLSCTDVASKRCLKKPGKPTVAEASFGQSIRQFQGGAEGIAALLEDAPPSFYLLYLLSAGIGLPCSEDALVVWVGAKLARGAYGNVAGSASVLSIVYFGVVVSDMITFGVGTLMRLGYLKGLKKSLTGNTSRFQKATAMIQRWSNFIVWQGVGFVQRFSLGFRGPLCLICGFTGVSARKFGAGVAVGALFTMPVQLMLGYLLRGSPSPYLTALALAAGPNLVGHVAGPLAAAAAFWFSARAEAGPGEKSNTVVAASEDLCTGQDL